MPSSVFRLEYTAYTVLYKVALLFYQQNLDNKPFFNWNVGKFLFLRAHTLSNFKKSA